MASKNSSSLYTGSEADAGSLAFLKGGLSDLTKFALYWSAIITISLVSFLVAASQLVVKPLKFQAPISSTDSLFFPDVSLTAEFISVDPITRIITMNWYPVLTSLNCSADEPFVTDIYIPVSLLDMSSPSWTAQPVDQAAFRVNSSLICTNSIQNPSFRTVTKLVASKENLQLQKIAEQSTLQNYPFDVYLAQISMYTRNLNTGVITIPKISDSFGIAVNFEISLLGETVNPSVLEENLVIYLKIGRSRAIKIFVVIVGVTNWLTATAFLTICTATIVYRPHKIYAEMFVVPVGALFAFTSIRANLPGAPTGFGATIDLFTILPVLVIMSFCSFTLLLMILYRRIYQEIKSGEKAYTGSKVVIEECVKPNSNLPRIPTLRNLPSSSLSISLPTEKNEPLFRTSLRECDLETGETTT